jgi:hypothetical protein
VKNKVIITFDNMNDKEELFMYFHILKIKKYVILLCINRNYRTFVFLLKFIVSKEPIILILYFGR